MVAAVVVREIAVQAQREQTPEELEEPEIYLQGVLGQPERKTQQEAREAVAVVIAGPVEMQTI